MEPQLDIVEELHKTLSKLYRDVSLMKQDGADPNEIDQHIAYFEMGWQDRLVIEQRAETRGRIAEIQGRVIEDDKTARQQASVQDNDLMRKMVAKDAPVAYWQSAPSRPTASHDRELDDVVKAETQRVSIETQAAYAAIGKALEQSLIEIDAGREPDVVTLVAQQIEKERQRAQRHDFSNVVRDKQQTHGRKQDY